MSIYADHLRSLVSSQDTAQEAVKFSFLGWTQTFYTILIITYFALLTSQIAPHVLPMHAEDYHRLDDAIHALATARNREADQIWQKIYFQLHISGLSDLKQSQVDDICTFILSEMVKNDSGL